MSNTVTVTKLVEGPRSAYFHVYLRGDGSSGDLVDQVLIDPATDFDPAQAKPGMRMSLRAIWYGTAGFDCLLKFQAGVGGYPVWVLPAGTSSEHICLNKFGGIQDRSGIDATGRLLLSTTGLTTTADQGSLVIQVNKTFKPFSVE